MNNWIDYQIFVEQAEIEKHQKCLKWLMEREIKKDESNPSEISSVSSFDNNNKLYGDIVEVTDKVISTKGNPVRWINIQPDYQDGRIGYCLNLAKRFEDKNNKELVTLKFIDPSTHIPSCELETVNLDYLIGQKVEFTLTDDGKYIKDFIGVVDLANWY